jgi:hypothetical protein
VASSTMRAKRYLLERKLALAVHGRRIVEV